MSKRAESAAIYSSFIQGCTFECVTRGLVTQDSIVMGLVLYLTDLTDAKSLHKMIDDCFEAKDAHFKKHAS